MQETMIQSVKADKLFIGMDLHKNTSTFVVKDREGKLIDSMKVLTDKNDVTRYINAIKRNNEDKELSLVVEPVSHGTITPT